MAERVGSSGGAAGGPACIIAAGGIGVAMDYLLKEPEPLELPPRFSEPAFTEPLVTFAGEPSFRTASPKGVCSPVGGRFSAI
jgi:hypothetical protein